MRSILYFSAFFSLCIGLFGCSNLANGCGGRGKVCPSIYMPVCGVDGKTYGNSCMARAAVAYVGKCLSYKVKIPKCKKGWSIVRKETKGKASKACPKGVCTTFVCQAPARYIRGTYSDPTCKGASCVASTHPFKGAVFSCPKGFSPATIKTKEGKLERRCKRN